VVWRSDFIRLVFQILSDAGGEMNVEKLLNLLSLYGVPRDTAEKYLKYMIVNGYLYKPSPDRVALSRPLNLQL